MQTSAELNCPAPTTFQVKMVGPLSKDLQLHVFSRMATETLTWNHSLYILPHLDAGMIELNLMTSSSTKQTYPLISLI